MKPLQDDIESQEEDEAYDENADEDFNPDSAAAGDNDNSSSDEDADEAEKASRKPGKRKVNVAADDLDSGDEATIKERSRKKRRKEGAEVDDDDSGDEWKVKTRSRKLAEKAERRQRRRATAGDVTVDVDQLWADLSSVPVGRVSLAHPSLDVDDSRDPGQEDKENAPGIGEDELVTIIQRVNFAGTIEEVEKQVPRNSKAAREYFEQHPEADPNHRSHSADSKGLHRPFKRPSMFEPNPLGVVKGVPPEKLRPRAPNRLDVQMAERRAEEKMAAVKMTTVQKSALDWRGFVAKSGFKDELDAYGKSNRGFLDREAFLGRAAATREQAARDARMKL